MAKKGANSFGQDPDEVILISITGGLIVIITCISVKQLITLLAHWPTVISKSSVLISFGVCFVTGVFFGYYPALKASNSDPTEALRYE